MRRRYSYQQQNNNIHALHLIATQQLRTSLLLHSYALPLMSPDCLSSPSVLHVCHFSIASRAFFPTSSSLRPRSMYVYICIYIYICMNVCVCLYVSRPPLLPWKASSANTNLDQPVRTLLPLRQGNGLPKRSQQLARKASSESRLTVHLPHEVK